MTRKHTFHLLLFIGLLFIPSLLNARQVEQLSLNFYDKQIRSSRKQAPVTIHLKKMLKKQYPSLGLRGLKLQRVVVVAKSRKGNGTAQLRSGESYSIQYRLNRSAENYPNGGRHSFERLTIPSPNYSSKGPWQLLLRGKMILRKVVLVVEREKKPSTVSILLPAQTWGTDLEGERGCNRRSGNVRDGWDYPDTVCRNNGKATYRGGYSPVHLYMRPNTNPLGRISFYSAVHRLQVEASISPSGKGGRRGTAATFGIEIGGRVYTEYLTANSNNKRGGQGLQRVLKISGKWSERDLQSAKVWILPSASSGDFTVNQLQLRVTNLYH